MTLTYIANRLNARARRFLRACLRLVFRFDRWNVIPLCDRDYARAIIQFLNALPPSRRRFLAEIGCGLADISRGARFSERLALDIDERPLRAARFLARLSLKEGMTFRPFSFPATPLEGRFDVIVMVNWIHNIEPAVLSRAVGRYVRENLVPGGFLLIDVIEDNPNYRFNHSISQLRSAAQCDAVPVGELFANRRRIYALSPLRGESSFAPERTRSEGSRAAGSENQRLIRPDHAAHWTHASRVNNPSHAVASCHAYPSLPEQSR